MPERVAVAGVKSYPALRPCPCCDCPRDELHERYGECSVDALPWKRRTHDELMAELERQLVEVKLRSPADLVALLAATRVRHTHPYGLVCKNNRDGHRFGLNAGDVSVNGQRNCMTHHDLETVSLPCNVWFLKRGPAYLLTSVSMTTIDMA